MDDLMRHRALAESFRRRGMAQDEALCLEYIRLVEELQAAEKGPERNRAALVLREFRQHWRSVQIALQPPEEVEVES